MRYAQADGHWGTPVNLTAETDRGIAGICPMVSPDGKYLFFISGRNGNNNSYWVEAAFIEALPLKHAAG